MIGALMTTPCLLRTRGDGEPDEYGDSSSSWTTTETVCALQQNTTGETRDGSLTVVTGWRAFLPGNVPVPVSGDELEVSGVRYALDGDAWGVVDPLGRSVSHVECSVRRVS